MKESYIACVPGTEDGKYSAMSAMELLGPISAQIGEYCLLGA